MPTRQRQTGHLNDRSAAALISLVVGGCATTIQLTLPAARGEIFAERKKPAFGAKLACPVAAAASMTQDS